VQGKEQKARGLEGHGERSQRAKAGRDPCDNPTREQALILGRRIGI